MSTERALLATDISHVRLPPGATVAAQRNQYSNS